MVIREVWKKGLGLQDMDLGVWRTRTKIRGDLDYLRYN
jgi:hypothetical protein